MHRERGSTLLANHAFVYHYILHLLPITTNVVQLCPIESNKSTTSVTLVKIFSSGRSSGADLWQNALEMAKKCIFQTSVNEKRAVVKRLSFNQLL